MAKKARKPKEPQISEQDAFKIVRAVRHQYLIDREKAKQA